MDRMTLTSFSDIRFETPPRADRAQDNDPFEPPSADDWNRAASAVALKILQLVSCCDDEDVRSMCGGVALV